MSLSYVLDRFKHFTLICNNALHSFQSDRQIIDLPLDAFLYNLSNYQCLPVFGMYLEHLTLQNNNTLMQHHTRWQFTHENELLLKKQQLHKKCVPSGLSLHNIAHKMHVPVYQ